MAAGGRPVEAGFVRRIVNRVRATREVRLSNPVTLQIRG
jgi:hypothetical protein